MNEIILIKYFFRNLYKQTWLIYIYLLLQLKYIKTASARAVSFTNGFLWPPLSLLHNKPDTLKSFFIYFPLPHILCIPERCRTFLSMRYLCFVVGWGALFLDSCYCVFLSSCLSGIMGLDCMRVDVCAPAIFLIPWTVFGNISFYQWDRMLYLYMWSFFMSLICWNNS